MEKITILKEIELTRDVETECWDLVIQSKTGLFDFRFREIWQYKDLLFLFVKRDFAALYKQTILGPLWHILQPLLTTVMFLMLFTKIAKIPTDGVHPILFYMSGLTIWNYFATCLTGTSNTFVANAGIFGKVYFPRMVIPLSVVLTNVVRFLIQFSILLLAMIVYKVRGESLQFGLPLLLLPALLALLAGIGLGLGLVISSLTTKYRDFGVLITFGVQLLMYATPVAYPLSYLNATSFAWFIKLNPLTGIVEAFRYMLFQRGDFNLLMLGYSVGFMVAVLLTGLIVFNGVEKKFIDTV